jgi:hypothetical protein
MIHLPSITGSMKASLEELGPPVPATIEQNDRIFMLLEVEIIEHRLGGYIARIPALRAFGEDDSKAEAALALREAIRQYISAFDDEQGVCE